MLSVIMNLQKQKRGNALKPIRVVLWKQNYQLCGWEEMRYSQVVLL